MTLENIEEFKSLPKVREKLKEYGFTKVYQEGEPILNEDSYIKAVPIVIEGSIRVVRTDQEGRQVLLYYVQKGESCVMSFLGGLCDNTSLIGAVAEEKTEILFIPIDKVSSMIKEFPEWLDYIFRLYHKRFEELLEVVNAVTFKKMDQRILDLLKKKVQQSNSNLLLVTHLQLAQELGTVRVVVSRLLKQLEEEGLVVLGRNRIELV